MEGMALKVHLCSGHPVTFGCCSCAYGNSPSLLASYHCNCPEPPALIPGLNCADGDRNRGQKKGYLKAIFLGEVNNIIFDSRMYLNRKRSPTPINSGKMSLMRRGGKGIKRRCHIYELQSNQCAMEGYTCADKEEASRSPSKINHNSYKKNNHSSSSLICLSKLPSIMNPRRALYCSRVKLIPFFPGRVFPSLS
jgi:hypothetical protein